MLATPPLFLEYEAVLKRPEQLGASLLSLTDVDWALDALARLIEPVEAHLSWRPQLPDPDDEMVLETAVNGRADALVTYNATHSRIAAARFGVRLARPVEIIREVIEFMSKATYPLKLPASAARLAKEDGVSLNQWIATAVAQKIGVVETAASFFGHLQGSATPEDPERILQKVPEVPADPEDAMPPDLADRLSRKG